MRLHGTFGKSFPVEMLFEFNLKDDITDVISEKMIPASLEPHVMADGRSLLPAGQLYT